MHEHCPLKGMSWGLCWMCLEVHVEHEAQWLWMQVVSHPPRPVLFLIPKSTRMETPLGLRVLENLHEPRKDIF